MCPRKWFGFPDAVGHQRKKNQPRIFTATPFFPVLGWVSPGIDPKTRLEAQVVDLERSPRTYFRGTGEWKGRVPG